MKTIALVVPVLLVSLIFGAVFTLGMLSVRSSAIATQHSIEMLRLHLEVVRMHEALAQQSRQNLNESIKGYSVLAAQ